MRQSRSRIQVRPELTLERLLVGLESELLAVTEADIVAATSALGMNISMKGSAAFLGVKYGYGGSLRSRWGSGG